MMDKRMHKLAGLAQVTEPPVLEGPPDAPLTFVAWGSTVGAVRDARELLAAKGVVTNLVRLPTVYPVHARELTETLKHARRTLLVEANYSGQLGRLIRTETGVDLSEKLLKYDGEPFYPIEIVGRALGMMGHVGQ
jgi:2-oxoglutarate ferredoxin oxidoreductase subunit alpha